jgi:hypothetical protein
MTTDKILFGGTPKLISLDGVANALTLNLRPGNGFVWHIVDAWGLTDDTSNRICFWTFYDGTTTLTKMGKTLLNTYLEGCSIYETPIDGANWYFRSGSPIIINYRNYAIFNAPALTAGKLIKIRAQVLEYGE